MKGPGPAAAAAPVGKRRWRCLAAACAALALLFFSVVVPLAVLLGLHARFPSMYLVDESAVSVYDGSEGGSWEPIPSEENDRLRVNDPVKELLPATSEEWTDTNASQPDIVIGSQPKLDELNGNISIHSAPPIQQATTLESSSLLNITDIDLKDNFKQGLPGDENGKSCQLEFGSYCRWSVEHKEVMKDSTVKRLKDQLFVARAYYPSIVKLEGMGKLSREMKQNIQDHERMLSDAISDTDLSKLHGVSMAKMDQTIAAAKLCAIECTNVEKKLRQLLDMTEDEAIFHVRQSAYLYRLGVQTLPKSLHCLSMRLTVDYFKSSADMEHSDTGKLENPAFRHYVIFSTNLLASSMTINSTVINSEESANMVFHLVTDAQNFYAFKNWFIRNSYRGATIGVLNFEDFQLKNLGHGEVEQLSPSEEFRVTSHSNALMLNTPMRTEYISMFGHSLSLLPELFSNLKRVIVLEDDTIVQRDLSLLWNLDLKGKVIGAVQFCGIRFSQLRAYLLDFPYDSSSCIWMSGVSVIDLDKWREHDVTGIYHRILQKLQHDTEASWRAAALPGGLLAFKDLMHPIEGHWVHFGLGHDYGLTHGAIKRAAILHYNGNMKPWLELGIRRYRKYWKRYLPRDEPFMIDCNVNP
ncbi:probable galacturonosyltransferase 7 isoform X1 [Phragmites australis]|uniref:probable galacturonosyltransferase 7 isoform X1 n=1 Tax=Phragmites australis TaxID=29695 RepID=UPI002D766F20|nr:probable galacturonosyltransferase 7 isoform X1 [Phragmites australis]